LISAAGYFPHLFSARVLDRHQPSAHGIQMDIKALSHRSKRCLRAPLTEALKIQHGDGLGGWTLDALDGDHELYQFMEGVPGFYESRALTTSKAILGSLSDLNGFHATLPWKRLDVFEHATKDKYFPFDVRQGRSRACSRSYVSFLELCTIS
jgi:hypothetical protein